MRGDTGIALETGTRSDREDIACGCIEVAPQRQAAPGALAGVQGLRRSARKLAARAGKRLDRAHAAAAQYCICNIADCTNFGTGRLRLDWPNWIGRNGGLRTAAAIGSGHALLQPRYRWGALGLGLGEGPDRCLLRVRASAAA